MGGVHASKAIGSDQYAWWNLQTVKAAHERLLAVLQLQGQRPSVYIPMNRRMFWEVFTDYAHVKDGTFLALPQELFASFAPPESPDIINGLHVMVVLCLLCYATRDEQLRMLFEVFDFNGDMTLTLDEMTSFLQTLVEACHFARMSAAKPSSVEVRRVAEEMFRLADATGDHEISEDEFLAWASTHMVAQRLLSALEKIRTVEQEKVDPKRMLRLATPAKKRVVLNDDGEDLETTVHNMRTRVENRVASRALVARLSQRADCPFTIHEVMNMRKSFITYADRTGQLTREKFNSLLSDHPSFKGETARSIGELFDVFDTDGSGSIDFQEFSVGMSKLVKGETMEKIEMLFAVYDPTNRGWIGTEELMKFVLLGQDESKETASFAKAVMAVLDIEDTGSISREKWTSALQENPFLFRCFTSGVDYIPGLDGVTRRIQDVRLEVRSVDLSTVCALWKWFEKLEKQLQGRCTMSMFRKGVTEVMKVPPAHIHPFLALFRLFELDVMRRIPWRPLVLALCQAVGGTDREISEFFFNMYAQWVPVTVLMCCCCCSYDTDGSGDIDKSEVMTVILHGEIASKRSADEASSVLTKLDLDGNGRLTLQNFKRACSDNPKLLKSFERLFGQADLSGDNVLGHMAQQVADLFKRSSSFRTARETKGGNTGSRKALERFRRQSLNTASAVVQHLQQWEEVHQISYTRTSAASTAAAEHARQMASHLRGSTRELHRDALKHDEHMRIVRVKDRNRSLSPKGSHRGASFHRSPSSASYSRSPSPSAHSATSDASSVESASTVGPETSVAAFEPDDAFSRLPEPAATAPLSPASVDFQDPQDVQDRHDGAASAAASSVLARRVRSANAARSAAHGSNRPRSSPAPHKAPRSPIMASASPPTASPATSRSFASVSPRRSPRKSPRPSPDSSPLRNQGLSPTQMSKRSGARSAGPVLARRPVVKSTIVSASTPDLHQASVDSFADVQPWANTLDTSPLHRPPIVMPEPAFSPLHGAAKLGRGSTTRPHTEPNPLASTGLSAFTAGTKSTSALHRRQPGARPRSRMQPLTTPMPPILSEASVTEELSDLVSNNLHCRRLVSSKPVKQPPPVPRLVASSLASMNGKMVSSQYFLVPT